MKTPHAKIKDLLRGKKLLVLCIGLSLLISFNFAQAQTTTSDLETLAQTLRQQIEELRARIIQLQEELEQATTGLKEVEKSLKFTKNLYKGLTDKEVEDLQGFLSGYPEIYPEGLITGYFGPLTEKAVKKFQKKYAKDILEPLGLNEGTGFVGSKTIAKINELTVNENKIIICHYPPGNPGARHTIEISESALEAHLAHGDTIGPCGDEPEPEPEDVCPNIDGVQETIPTGMIQDDDGNCVEPEPGAILGCTNQTALNYNPRATQDNGTCIYPDTTPPVISNIQASNVPYTTAPVVAITWQTNEKSDSVVNYGLTTSYGYTVSQETDVLSHKINISSNLIGGKTYHYRVSSTDEAGNKAQSSDKTFTVPDTSSPNEVSNFTAIAGDRQISLSWTNPTNEDFAGVKIVRYTADHPYPNGITIYTGTSTGYIDTNLLNDVPVWYRAFTYDKEQNYSSGVGIYTIPILLPGQFLLSWGSYGGDNGQFRSPSGLAIDADDNIYVTDSNIGGRIQKFTSNGNFITKWQYSAYGDNQLPDPRSIAIDSNGNMYVAAYNRHRIQKFTSNGVFVTSWGSEGSGNGQFFLPTGIAIDSNNNVYVTDFNHRVQKFTSNGVFIKKWGSLGTGDGQLSSPADIVIDDNDDIYVVELGNRRVQKFTSNGVFINKWSGNASEAQDFTLVGGIAVDSNNGNIYVTDRQIGRVLKFTNKGEFLTQWGNKIGVSRASGYGEFSEPDDVVVDSSGNIYVLDRLNNRIQKFSPE